VLLALLAVLVAGKLLEDTMVGRLRADCESLFADRLLPATTLFHLSDEMHRKQRSLERFLAHDGGATAEPIQGQLGQYDARLEQLTREVEQTYLVADESRHLRDFRAALGRYQKAERDLLQRRQAGEAVSYGPEMTAAFGTVREALLSLTTVQQRVGEQLRNESVSGASGVLALLHLQLGVAFVLGLLAAGLAMTLGLKPPTIRPGPHRDLH
jgi:hypothetical protein